MFDVFFATLSPMLVMFACMVIGFILNKKKLAPENTATVLSKLETNVLLPALNIGTFMKYCTVSSLQENGAMVLFSAIIAVLAVAIALPLSGVFCRQGYTRNIYKYALTFGNYGFMGNAIVPAILGEEFLYTYMLFTLPLLLVGYTWGTGIMIPAEKAGNPLKRLCNPIFFSILIGMVLGLTGATAYIPSFITTTISNLSACMGPLAMVLTGFIIGNYSFRDLLNNKKVYIASVLRLFVFPALFVVLLKLLGADDLTVTLCLFAYATPLGLNTVVFPAAYGGDTSTGAAMATISHTVCVITIPIMYALLTVFL